MRGLLMVQLEASDPRAPGVIEGWKVSWLSGTSTYKFAVYRHTTATETEVLFHEVATWTELNALFSQYGIPLPTRVRALIQNRG